MFDFLPEQEIPMWMKNTYVSLDMISSEPMAASSALPKTRARSKKIIPQAGR